MNQVTFSMRDLAPVILESIKDGGTFPLTVNGNSMYPLLRHGRDTVYFASLTGHKIRRGDILLFVRQNGTYVMHRVYKLHPDGSCDFLGDNQSEIEKGIAPEQILAFVPFVERDGRRISCEKGLHHRMLVAFMRPHIHCVPFARLLLKVNSVLHKLFLVTQKKKNKSDP